MSQDKALDPSDSENANDFMEIERRPIVGDTPSLAEAYTRLGLANPFAAKTVLEAGGGFERVKRFLTENKVPAIDQSILARSVESLVYEIPVIDPDDSPARTAEATERMALLLQDVHAVTADLVRLTAANLQLTEARQVSAKRTERFTRGMTWTSLVVAVGSLCVAVVAVYL